MIKWFCAFAHNQRKEGDTISRIDKQNQWRDEKTKSYNFRIMYDTGIPEAMEAACKKTGENTSQYIKKSIVLRLKAEGFLSDGEEIVLNKTEQRHKERLQRLKEYIAAEENKMK